jgi:hypothetical protein
MARIVKFRIDVDEFADLLRRGPKTSMTLDDWVSNYPEPIHAQRSPGVRDARTVYNRLALPDWFLELSEGLSAAGTLPPDLLTRARDAVRAVGPKKDGSDNVIGQAAAFRRQVPFETILGALRAYVSAGGSKNP